MDDSQQERSSGKKSQRKQSAGWTSAQKSEQKRPSKQKSQKSKAAPPDSGNTLLKAHPSKSTGPQRLAVPSKSELLVPDTATSIRKSVQFWIDGDDQSEDEGQLLKLCHHEKNYLFRSVSLDDVHLLTQGNQPGSSATGIISDQGEVDGPVLSPPFLPRGNSDNEYAKPVSPARSRSRCLSSGSRTLAAGISLVNWADRSFVNTKILDRHQIKEVRRASQNLLDYGPEPKYSTKNHSHHNPVFQQAVYGGEQPERSRSLASLHELKSTESSHSKTPCQEKAGNFLFGRDAYQYYLRHRGELDYIDRQVILPHVAELRQRLVNKKKHVSEVLERAREYYSRPYQDSSLDLLVPAETGGSDDSAMGANLTYVRKRLGLRLTFTPWFLFSTTLLQALAIAILCSVTGVVSPRLTHQKVLAEDVMTWGGGATLEHLIKPNLWAGPSVEHLLSSGALIPACLRNDKTLLLRRAIYDVDSTELGCCEASGRGAGTTTEQECDQLKIMFKIGVIEWKNVSCSKRVFASRSPYVPHAFKPCCLPGSSECVLISHQHCVILGGKWHIAGIEHCGQARCDKDFCLVFSSSQHAEIAHSKAQFWRLPLSLLYHQGIIHLALYTSLQLIVGISLEQSLGWFWFGVTYLTCGTLSLMFGSAFVTNYPNTGTGGAICGMAAMQLAELGIASHFIKSKGKMAMKHVLVLTVVYLTGLLPGINQFTNLFGTVLGALLGLSILPAVSLTAKMSRVHKTLQLTSAAVLVLLVITTFYIFYIAQPLGSGSFKYLNCMAFVDYACDDYV